jgi:hypothetical protein
VVPLIVTLGIAHGNKVHSLFKLMSVSAKVWVMSQRQVDINKSHKHTFFITVSKHTFMSDVQYTGVSVAPRVVTSEK